MIGSTIAQQQECPRCGGAIGTEGLAVEQLHDGHEVTFLNCDFCQAGIETLWKTTGGRRQEVFSVEYGTRHAPVKYGEFKQRLKDRRVA